MGDREFQVVWCRSQLLRMYLRIFFDSECCFSHVSLWRSLQAPLRLCCARIDWTWHAGLSSWDLSGLLPVLLEGLRQQDDVWCAWRESGGARLCQRARFQEKGEGGGKVSIRMFLALRRSLSFHS